MLKYDFTKLGKEQVYPLLNASVTDPKYVLTEKDVSVKSISHIGNAPEGSPNSIISLEPVAGSRIVDPESGVVKRDYFRFDLADVLNHLGAELEILDDPALYDTNEKVAIKFSEVTGIAFEPSELKITITPVDGDLECTIIVAANHIAFVGQTQFKILDINRKGEHLNKIMRTDTLDGWSIE